MEKITEKEEPLKLVLNGGSSKMDGATIPIKWFFSPELVKNEEPRYILLVDLAKGEEESGVSGRRYMVKVEKVVKFIQLFKSGKHTLLALVFDYIPTAYLEKESDGSYKKEVPIEHFNEEKDQEDKQWGLSLASCKVEFEVPKELFAKKPETKLGKIWWKYLFWPKRPKAKDECQVRKLSWFFSWMKLPLFMIVNLLYSLYTITASLILSFFGFNPLHPKALGYRLTHPVMSNWTLDVRAGENDVKFLHIYDRYGNDTGKKFWFSPFFLTLFIPVVYASILLFPDAQQNAFSLFLGLLLIGIFTPVIIGININRFLGDSEESFLVTISIATFVLTASAVYTLFWLAPDMESVNSIWSYIISGIILLGILVLVFAVFFQEKLSNWFNDLKSKKEKKIKESYRQYLLKNFTKPEEKVTLDHLPETYEDSKLKRDATVRFWTTKAKVCRPYES